MPKTLRVVLNVSDLGAVTAFYVDIMGFAVTGGWDRGPADQGALLQVTGGAVIEVVGHGPSFPTPAYDHDAIAVELNDRREVDDYRARLVAAGIAVGPPVLQSWGHYSMSLRDPVGLEIVLYADEAARGGA